MLGNVCAGAQSAKRPGVQLLVRCLQVLGKQRFRPPHRERVRVISALISIGTTTHSSTGRQVVGSTEQLPPCPTDVENKVLHSGQVSAATLGSGPIARRVR